MNRNLLRGFLGSAAALALALNVNADNAQGEAVDHFKGLNFGVGYGFELSNHGEDEKDDDDKVPSVELKKATIFGKDAKTKVESNGTFSNLGGVAVEPESHGDGDDWKTYEEEKENRYEADYGHSQELSFIDIQVSDEKKRRNMQHYGWLSAGWLYPISGDFFVEPQLTLKVKGTPEKRKVEDSDDVYSQYLAGKIGTSAVQVNGDTKYHRTAALGESDYGDLLVKVGTYKMTNSIASANVAIETAAAGADTVEGTYYKLDGAKTHVDAQVMGKTVDANNSVDAVLKEKILGSKDASGTKLSQSIYMTRTLDFELKNNFEAALHANLGYAFNQYFAVYAKLGMSLDFYKLDYKKGAIETGIDDYAFDPMNFKVDVGDVVVSNMYVSGKDGKAVTGAFDGDKLKILKDKELDLYMRVSREKRTGAKAEWDKDAKALKPADQKDIQKMLADAKVSVEKADDDVTTSKKSTFVSLNADFGLGMMANVYKGLQVRAEFVYSLPMNKEKKMYNDNVTLTMKPHKFKFNFGVVVPLNMIMGK